MTTITAVDAKGIDDPTTTLATLGIAVRIGAGVITITAMIPDAARIVADPGAP